MYVVLFNIPEPVIYGPFKTYEKARDWAKGCRLAKDGKHEFLVTVLHEPVPGR